MIPILLFIAALPRIHDGKPEPAGYVKVPPPVVRIRANQAGPTGIPWIDANGWRFERGLRKAFYATLPRGAAALAAAEAYAYGVDALIQPDEADRPSLAKMLEYLESIDQPAMPLMANIGVIDDGSAIAGEVMNMLGRRNLLYRVVSKPDPKLTVTVSPTGAEARNPSTFAARIREKVTDDKRLVRLFNASTVVARLTGDGTRARLHLINYSGRPITDLRVRVLGGYGRVQPFPKDVVTEAGAVEFTVPELATYMVVDLEPARRAVSLHSKSDFDLTADPAAAQWRNVPAVHIDRKFMNGVLPGQPTEVRSRWTAGNLYLLFSCPFDELHLKPEPQTESDTNKLWDWDVAEVFLGSEFDHIGHYREFEVSPRGEWVDLDIDRDHPGNEQGIGWNSGFVVKARVDQARKIWYGEMRIPFASLGVKSARAGVELRTGFYRCAGTPPNRWFAAWSATGQRSFHGPHAFGRLRLE